LIADSIYRYFASRDEMVAELCEREIPKWLDAIQNAMSDAGSIDEKAAAFAAAQLELVVAGHHRMAGVLANAPLSAETLARIHALTHAPTVHLEHAMAEAGHPRPQVTAALVQGLVSAAFRLLQNGGDHAEVIPATTEAVRRAVEW
jgi:AcrR family transcriptional regulator